MHALIDLFGPDSTLATVRFLGLPLVQWALALATAVVAYLAITLSLRFALARARRVAARTGNRVDDIVLEVLRHTHRGLIALAALLIGLGLLDLSGRWSGRVSQLWFIALAVQVALWLNAAIGLGLRRYREQHGAGMTQVSASATRMSWALRTILWSIVVLAILSNLGVNITAFVASLGVGGIAVALAVQGVLADVFASLAIAVDKPFEVGDFIVFGDVAGSVEYVGLKSTRLRSISGEQVIVSNTDLLKQVLKNYKRMQQRRIVFTFGVTYDTTAQQAAAIPGVVKRIVEAGPKLRFDRAHFLKFGDSSLDYEVVYIVQDADYTLYMDEQQRINLELMRQLAAMGVEFAFPTRTVYVVGEAGKQAPASDGAGREQTGAAREGRPPGPQDEGGAQGPSRAASEARSAEATGSDAPSPRRPHAPSPAATPQRRASDAD